MQDAYKGPHTSPGEMAECSTSLHFKGGRALPTNLWHSHGFPCFGHCSQPCHGRCGEESIVHLSTTFWKRYVDDTLTALRQDKVQRFNEHLNTIETTLQFTVEMEIEGTLPFLDTRVTHYFDGSLSTTVVRKNTRTDKCLDFQSHHPLAHKGPVARTRFNCAEKICSEFPDSKKEKEQVEKVLQNNGYPRRLVVASTITRSQLPIHPQPQSPNRTSIIYLRPSEGYWPHLGFAHISSPIAHFNRR